MKCHSTKKIKWNKTDETKLFSVVVVVVVVGGGGGIFDLFLFRIFIVIDSPIFW